MNNKTIMKHPFPWSKALFPSLKKLKTTVKVKI